MTMARPTLITDDVVAKLEEMFRIDATCGEACTHAGISYDAYNERMNKDPVFRQRMESAQAFPFLVAKKTIIKAINEGNGELALKVLKSRQREIYYEKQKNETDLTTGGQPFNVTSAISPSNAITKANSAGVPAEKAAE